MQKRSRTRKRTSILNPESEAIQLTKPFRVLLPNGVTILGEKLPFVESVAVGVWINVGSRDEKSAENGITHLTEHMVFKGTEHFSGSEIVDSIEGRGGYINAFTTKEFSCYYAKVFREDLQQAIGVLADLVRYPVFDEKDLSTERKVVLSELHEVLDDPEDWGMDYIEEKLFEGNPLSMPVIGKTASINGFKAADLLKFHARNFTPDKVVISAVGNFDRRLFVDLVSTYFSSMAQHGNLSKRKKPVQKAPGRYTVRRLAGRQAHILLAAPAPGMDGQDRFAAAMVGVIIGDGSSSRLYKSVREKEGIAYSIYSYGSSYVDVGIMGVYAGTSVKDLKRAEEKIYSTIDEFSSVGPTADEVSRAKYQLKAGIVFSLENPWDRASLFARDELCYGEKANVAESLELIERVKPAEIADAAAAYFSRDRITTLLILPNQPAVGKMTGRINRTYRR